MARLYANNYKTALTSTIGAADLTMDVDSVVGLPALSGADYFYLTIDDGSFIEIVKVTSISVNTLAIERGLEGTAPRAFVGGVDIELRSTAESFGTINGSDSNEINISPAGDISKLSDALDIVNSFYTANTKWSIICAPGTYTELTGSLVDGRNVDISCPSGVAVFDYDNTSSGITITNAKSILTSISCINSTQSGVNVKVGGEAQAYNCLFNSNAFRGIQARDGGIFYTSGCETNNNALSGAECLLRGSGSVFNHTSDNNGWAGYTATNSSIMYVNGSTGTGNTRYCLEVAGSSLMYGRDVDAIDGSLTAAAYLCSGSSQLYIHTCTTLNCARPVMAEYGATISVFKFNADAGVSPLSVYPVFFSEYDSTITIVTTPGDPTVTTDHTKLFEARYGSRLVSNRPSYFTLTGVTAVSTPDIGVYGNDNSFVDMDNLLSQSKGQEGTYTPTLTDVANGGSPTTGAVRYRRDGDTMTVFGQLSRGTITNGVASQSRISLPVPSNMSSASDLVGYAYSTSSGTTQRAIFYADTVNDEALLTQDASTTLSGASFIYYEFRYKII